MYCMTRLAVGVYIAVDVVLNVGSPTTGHVVVSCYVWCFERVT